MIKNHNPRSLLAAVRQGDYAHPGSEEAIDIVLNGMRDKCPQSKLKILDAGCGRGGSAAYIKNKMECDIQGFDVDIDAITAANANYPSIKFTNTDILKVSQKITDSFDVIYLFNVFYALEYQQESLKELARLSKPGTILAIFDYVSLDEKRVTPITDLAGKHMRPVSLSNLKTFLNNFGWELLEIKMLSKEYEAWYEDFQKKLEVQKEVLLAEFTKETYKKVHHTFSVLLKDIKESSIGGAVVYAKMVSPITNLFAVRQSEQNYRVKSKHRQKITNKTIVTTRFR